MLVDSLEDSLSSVRTIISVINSNSRISCHQWVFLKVFWCYCFAAKFVSIQKGTLSGTKMKECVSNYQTISTTTAFQSKAEFSKDGINIQTGTCFSILQAQCTEMQCKCSAMYLHVGLGKNNSSMLLQVCHFSRILAWEVVQECYCRVGCWHSNCSKMHQV